MVNRAPNDMHNDIYYLYNLLCDKVEKLQETIKKGDEKKG